MREHILYVILSYDNSQMYRISGDRFCITTMKLTTEDIDDNRVWKIFGQRYSTIYCDTNLYSLRKEFIDCCIKGYCTLGKREFILI